MSYYTNKKKDYSAYQIIISIVIRKNNLNTKRKVYLSFVAPVQKYDIELHENTCKSNLWGTTASVKDATHHGIRSKHMYQIVPLHSDLRIPYVNDVYVQEYQKFFNKLQFSSNPNINCRHCYTLPENPSRRLKKRKWRRDALPITWRNNKISQNSSNNKFDDASIYFRPLLIILDLTYFAGNVRRLH